MNEDQRKHLEFIQNVITRMNSNSFSIKAWAVTISSASIGIFVSAKIKEFLLIGVFASAIFWFLDSFYLHQEKKYRGLYENVRLQNNITLYDMNASQYKKGFCEYFKVILSKTIFPFYTSIILILIIAFVYLKLTQ